MEGSPMPCAHATGTHTETTQVHPRCHPHQEGFPDHPDGAAWLYSDHFLCTTTFSSSFTEAATLSFYFQ